MREFSSQRGLSERETDVLVAFASAGSTTKEIADQFGLAYQTVRQYWTRICVKLGCRDPVGVLVFVLEQLLTQAMLGASPLVPASPDAIGDERRHVSRVRDLPGQVVGQRILPAANDIRTEVGARATGVEALAPVDVPGASGTIDPGPGC